MKNECSVKTWCQTCGMEIEKNEKTEKMENLFADVWCDKNGRFGLSEPYHWHKPNPNTEQLSEDLRGTTITEHCTLEHPHAGRHKYADNAL